IVVIMQRLHEKDVSGKILSSESDDWVHLMIPMRYDPGRHSVTVPVGVDQITWEDPRTEASELMWPERFGAAQVDAIEAGLGPVSVVRPLAAVASTEGRRHLQAGLMAVVGRPRRQVSVLRVCYCLCGRLHTEGRERSQRDDRVGRFP